MNIDTSKVTRFEVIDDEGRKFVIKDSSIKLSLQDAERTLKVFVKGVGSNPLSTDSDT